MVIKTKPDDVPQSYSPDLFDLLRERKTTGEPKPRCSPSFLPSEDDSDDLNAVRGIITGMLIGLFLWSVAGVVLLCL